MARGRIWFICDCLGSRRDTPCIYSGEAVEKLKTDPLRCIRHGNLLFSSAYYDGWSRREVEREVHQEKGNKHDF